jgi:hypothetical protein
LGNSCNAFRESPRNHSGFIISLYPIEYIMQVHMPGPTAPPVAGHRTVRPNQALLPIITFKKRRIALCLISNRSTHRTLPAGLTIPQTTPNSDREFNALFDHFRHQNSTISCALNGESTQRAAVWAGVTRRITLPSPHNSQ